MDEVKPGFFIKGSFQVQGEIDSKFLGTKLLYC